MGVAVYLPAVDPGGSRAVSGAEAKTQGNLSPGHLEPWPRQAGRLSHRDVSLPYKAWRRPGGFQATPTTSKGQLPVSAREGTCWDWEMVLVGGGGSWVASASYCLSKNV